MIESQYIESDLLTTFKSFQADGSSSVQGQPFGRANDEGQTLETSALKLFTVADLRYRLSWWYQINLLYSPTDAAPQFL